MSLTRRHLLRRGAAFSLGFAGLHAFFASGRAYASVLADGDAPTPGYGPLLPDKDRILDLPKGFSYTIISRRGQTMADGLLVPGQPDGTAAFIGPRGTTILVRNHEVGPDHAKMTAFGEDLHLLDKVSRDKLYDFGGGKIPGGGGTTTLVYNTKDQRLEKQFLSLAGTYLNCAGGATPWGSWLSCEEDVTTPGMGVEKLHGYVFEVPATEAMEIAPPLPIKAMGRFRHEAVSIDPRTGVVYLTEDREDGLIYRYLPEHKQTLLKGGRLQALCVRAHKSLDTSNHKDAPAIAVGQKLDVEWMDLEDIDAPKDDLRFRYFAAGAARFARNEGMWYGNGGIYFAATIGGKSKKGQLWKYTPAQEEGAAGETSHPGTLELFVEPNESTILENPDNVTVSPWGDLVVCEDEVSPGNGVNFLLGITPRGEIYKLGKNAKSPSEFTGTTFSPDGTTLFVNLQDDGLTLAITGPWKKA